MKLKLKDPLECYHTRHCITSCSSRCSTFTLKAAHGENAPLHITALAIFILTMILLYTASTVYHSVDSTEKVNLSAQKNGSHDDLCYDCREVILQSVSSHFITEPAISSVHFHGVIAILGILLKGLWITCPKWLSSVLYIGMGWLCVLAFVPIFIPFREADLMASCRWYHLYDRWCDL